VETIWSFYPGLLGGAEASWRFIPVRPFPPWLQAWREEEGPRGARGESEDEPTALREHPA